MTTTATTTAAPIEQLVHDLLDAQEIAAETAERIAGIKAQIADVVGVGCAVEVGGVTATVRAPSRRFNATRAWALLTPEQQAVSVSPDAKKIKAQLAPVLVEECMDEGAGSPVVSVK